MYDHLRIHWDTDTYVVTYKADVKETDVANTSVSNSFETSNPDAILDYMDTMLTLVIKDNSPFATIDVLIPCFPSVKFRPSNLEEVRDCIQKSIRMWL